MIASALSFDGSIAKPWSVSVNSCSRGLKLPSLTLRMEIRR